MSRRGGGGTRLDIAAVAALVVLTFAVYANSLSNGFLMDDTVQIVYNDWIKDIRALPSLYSTHTVGYAVDSREGVTYRPLFLTLYMVEYALFGLKPWGWHLVNIILHAANTVMVFIVARGLIAGEAAEDPPAEPYYAAVLPAFAAAVVFGVHPAKSEAVSWVGCAPELIFTFLCLLSFHLYAKADEGRKGRIYLSVLFFFSALFAKETALSLLPVLLVYDLLVKGRPGLSGLKRYAPYVGAAALYFAIRMYALGGVVPRESIYAYLDGPQVLLNAVALLARYLKELFFPAWGPPMQLLDPVFSAAEPRALASMAFVAAAPVALLFLRRRISPLYTLCLALVVLPLLPALYIPGLHRHTFTNRYLYFPSVGFALFAGLLFAGAWGRGVLKRGRVPAAAALAVFSVVAVLYSFSAVKRNPLWKDDLTFWSHLAEGPDDYYARVIAGRLLADRSSGERAERYFTEAIAIMDGLPYADPSVMAEARAYLANMYYASGRVDEALAEYRELHSLYPEHPVANYQLGVMYQEKGLCYEAVSYYSRAAALFTDPGDIKDSYINMGNCYVRMGLVEKAAESYTEALAVSPGDPVAMNYLRLIGKDAGGAPKR